MNSNNDVMSSNVMPFTVELEQLTEGNHFLYNDLQHFYTAVGDCITIRYSSRSGFVAVFLEKPVEPAFRPA